ncbi:MAG: aconitase family protein, partial [Saprospiraceae bacterium]|nr:aconitase family protein [Saprospiraceae bacterium]
SGCMGCIGMGQAPAVGKISLRTMPRNFPGRSGTLDDQVFLCSPETAAASALTGQITDPRDLEKQFNMKFPRYEYPVRETINTEMLIAPPEDTSDIEIIKGPNIASFPDISPLTDEAEVPVLLKMDDNISTDEILRAGAEVLPLRSNIPEISKYSYIVIDDTFYDRAQEAKKEHNGHIVIGGENYAQGSSREHAALAPKYLGQVAVIAKSYARIGWQNLVNFGIVPLEFIKDEDYDNIEQGDMLKLENLRDAIAESDEVTVKNTTQNTEFKVRHSLSDRQREILLEGGIINVFRKEQKQEA